MKNQWLRACAGAMGIVALGATLAGCGDKEDPQTQYFDFRGLKLGMSLDDARKLSPPVNKDVKATRLYCNGDGDKAFEAQEGLIDAVNDAPKSAPKLCLWTIVRDGRTRQTVPMVAADADHETTHYTIEFYSGDDGKTFYLTSMALTLPGDAYADVIDGATNKFKAVSPGPLYDPSHALSGTQGVSWRDKVATMSVWKPAGQDETDLRYSTGGTDEERQAKEDLQAKHTQQM